MTYLLFLAQQVYPAYPNHQQWESHLNHHTSWILFKATLRVSNSQLKTVEHIMFGIEEDEL